MSEQSRGPAESSRDVLAVWQKTRDLGTRLDGVNERLESLEELRLADRVADLSLTVKKLTEKPDSPKLAVWNWSAMNPQQRAQAWAILLDWTMNIFRKQHPRSFTEMLGYNKASVSCWHLHMDMVEALTALMGAWHWAYTDPESGPLRTAEWMDRWRPNAVRQGVFILEGCNLYPEPDNPYAGHKNPLENKQTDPPQDLLQHMHLLKTGEMPS